MLSIHDAIIAGLVIIILILTGITLGLTIKIYVQINPTWWPKEKRFDASIKAPTQNMYLVQFNYSPLLGASWCRPTWYAFRYVRQDGSYSKLSPWTTLPVQAGAKVQPCINGDCTTLCSSGGTTQIPCVLTGYDSCACNRPEVGVIENLDYDIKLGEYYAVIHRQIDTFDPTSEGQQIGTLLPKPFDTRGITYSFADTLYNENSGSSCDRC